MAMWEKAVTLKDGTEILLRPGTSEDLEMVWEMLSTLSEDSLRFLPHPIKREDLETSMNELDYEKLLPIVAAIKNPPSEKTRIVALATLGFQQGISRRHRAEFDIVVHDEFQGKGLGTLLTQHMIDIAREKGLKKIHLKTSTENKRAIHTYKKLGFKIEGVLEKEHFHHLTKEYGNDYRMAIML